MSPQTTTAQQTPVPLARQLVDLRRNIASGMADRSDVQGLATKLGSSKLGDQLRTYLYCNDSQFLEISLSEAFKTVVYHQEPRVAEPVRWEGAIVPSPSPGAATGLPVIYSRQTLFPDVMVMYWRDDPIEHYEFEEGRQERVLHAPLTLEWDGVLFNLLCETANKSFYWPTQVPVPLAIEPWLTARPQDRTTLSTGLKRQGYTLRTFQGIGLNANMIYTDLIWDLGVCVLPDERVLELSDELGLSMDATQITLWFSDGSYFKGCCQSSTLSGLSPGFYGGLKRPQGAEAEATCIAGSVMDSFQYVPWSASINRQQCDYANLDLPVRSRLPSQETFLKASTGFPAYIQQLNDQVISNAANIFRKCDVKGFAGKVALGVSNETVQFIIRGPSLSPGIRTMAFLFSPALPIHTNLMKVRVQFVQDERMDGNLIQLNVGDGNLWWVAKWYIAWAGRDNDGDGIVLSSDPIVLKNSVHWSEIKWIDTTQYKSTNDNDVDGPETAIRVATERIRHFSGRIGIYDKIARRIVRQDSRLMTWEVRLLLTEAIQRSISATKKNSGSDEFSGYSWIIDKLPDDCDEWLFENVHDEIDSIRTVVKDVLNVKNGRELVTELPEYKQMILTLDGFSSEMPNHYAAAIEVLDLLQEFPKDQYHKIKERGRILWAKHQADSPSDVIEEVLQFVSKSKHLWQSVYSNDPALNPGFNYANAALVIRKWAVHLSQTVNSHLMIGAMVTNLSLNLLGHVLDVEDIQYSGFTDGIYLPISTDEPIQAGMVGSYEAFASLVCHDVYRQVLPMNKRYRVETVFPTSGAKWNTNPSPRLNRYTAVLRLKEVISC